MKDLIKGYLKGDTVLWVITLFMLMFSLLSVYSFVSILVKVEGGSPFHYLFKHFIYVLIACFSMYWVHKQDPKYFAKLSKLGYLVGIGLLIFTLFFGTKVNEAGRWIQIPFVGLTFQSSDFAKLALIVYLARLLSKKEAQLHSWKEGFVPIVLPIILVFALIVKDNFSTAALLFMVCLIILFVGRVPIKHMAIFIASGLLLFAMVVGVHKAVPELNILPRFDTWMNRISNRYQNANDIDAAGNLQANNAKLAIYNGGFTGQGVGDGKLKSFIPEAYADFYYASFVEEFGTICAFFLILFYLIILYRIIKIGIKADKLFESLTCFGIGILLLSQAMVNMMVCTGIFPVTGQNMPFLAMGGSAMIMACVSIGIVQSIAARQQLVD